ncbi:MAG: DUF2071 domain-containing protein [Opitutaceae bacterium]
MKPLRPGTLLERLACLAGGFVADWRDVVFLHYALPAVDLAPHVPQPLDVVDGRAFVSLVSFELERMRPARAVPPMIGRWLMRPFSDHQFLNLRTCVRGAAGPGIHFIAEWINNPLSARVGPSSYGLPYRKAAMTREFMHGSGLRRIAVRDAETNAAASLVVPITPDAPPRKAAAGSLDAFLLERYRAYTHTGGKSRHFEINHPRWLAAPFRLARSNMQLLDDLYPWFKYTTFIGGHLAAGFEDVVMGPPRGTADPAKSKEVEGCDGVTVATFRPSTF